MLLGPGVDGPLAVKPTDTEAPAASDGAHEGPAAVIVVPDWVTVAFQPLPSVTPDGTVHVMENGFAAEEPVFFTVTAPW
jgi:hypothetical protein